MKISFILMFLLSNLLIFADVLPGFRKSIYFDEQILQIQNPVWAPETKIMFNAPSATNFNPKKKTMLVIYALPNGNSIEQTIGNKDSVAADWHYDIQHIGAQTRFLRTQIKDANLVICYLEAKQKSWGSWRKLHSDSIIRTMVDSIRAYFPSNNISVILNGHSGGGNFVFGFINSYSKIPDFIERIAFLDSNYAYDETLKHGKKLVEWLKTSKRRNLCILAYNDSIALYNGKSFVSATGGTWYRSKMMLNYFKSTYKFKCFEDTSFIKCFSKSNQIEILLKKNPNRAIFHTIQVERNGFIHSILSGTKLENQSYQYYSLEKAPRIYENLIQNAITAAGAQFPSRPNKAISGTQFMLKIDSLPWQQREAMILEQLKTGNFPQFLRKFRKITFQNGRHICEIEVLPDYLAIGTDADYCRIPMTPQTAQVFADITGCSLPTSLIVDTIWKYSEIKLFPINFKPNGRDNEQVWMFSRHNSLIETQLHLYKSFSKNQIIDGIKKDIVLCNRLKDLPNKVAIYGWYKPYGIKWQPLYTGHIHWYVDYSHGIRLVNSLVWVDGKPMNIQDILQNKELFQLLSNETTPMEQACYKPISDNIRK